MGGASFRLYGPGRHGFGAAVASLVVAALVSLLLPNGAACWAASPAGTVISNTAIAEFDSSSAESNEVTLTVAQVAGVEITPLVASHSGEPGTSVVFPAVIANTGNGEDAFSLTASSAEGWPLLVYRDENADEVHQATETTVVDSTGPLALGTDFHCLAVLTLPEAAAGSDIVTLTATSAVNPACSAVATYTADVFVTAPSADFAASPTSGAAPLSVAFTDLSTGEPTSWSWDFGDGTTSSEQNPTHSYAAEGDYTVALTVTNAGGSDTETKTDYIAVSAAAPAADFSASPMSGEAPLSVSFTDLSTGEPASWSWDFGDGTTSSEQNPTHSYAAEGTYTVALTVTDAGGTDTETKSDYITVSIAAPAADFSATPTSGEAPLSVAFTDLSTGEPTSWSWDFGDGTTSSEQNPSHEYVTNGTYTVSLTVANIAGEDLETKTDHITVSQPALPPGAEFTATPTQGAAPLEVAFSDRSSGDPQRWQWDFGDDSASSEQNPVHVYAKPGRYTVALTVWSDAGMSTETKPDYILVEFRDVPPTHWAYGDIMECLDAGIVEGYPNDKFHPNWAVSRDQMAAYVARALSGGDMNVPEGPASPTFSDVPPDHWAYDSIEYVRSREVIVGYPDGTFEPSRLMDRALLAVFLARSLVTPTGEEGIADYSPPETPTFKDVPPHGRTAWCYKHVEYLASQGILSGYGDGRFRPNVTLSRDQTAVFIARAFDLTG